MTYLIDGKPAQGEDYALAIESLPIDDLDCVQIGTPDRGYVSVSTIAGGFLVTDERPDGSSWAARSALTKEQVKNLVASFLSGSDKWRTGLEWELVVLTRQEGRRRTMRILLIGAVVVALALLVRSVLNR